MKIEDLTEEQREFIHGLKNYSSTIECDIRDALDNANSIAEFIKLAKEYMSNLKAECNTVTEEIEGWK